MRAFPSRIQSRSLGGPRRGKSAVGDPEFFISDARLPESRQPPRERAPVESPGQPVFRKQLLCANGTSRKSTATRRRRCDGATIETGNGSHGQPTSISRLAFAFHPLSHSRSNAKPHAVMRANHVTESPIAANYFSRDAMHCEDNASKVCRSGPPTDYPRAETTWRALPYVLVKWRKVSPIRSFRGNPSSAPTPRTPVLPLFWIRVLRSCSNGAPRATSVACFLSFPPFT